MRIIQTTDNKFINYQIPNLNKREEYMLDDFRFIVQKKQVFGKRIVFSNSNYVVVATEE